MAVRYRKGRASPWQAYWNNPITGKRESKNFLTQQEAEKHDALVKYRIRFERDSFAQEVEADEEPESGPVTLQMLFLEYMKRKQFDKDGVRRIVSNSRLVLQRFGEMPVQDITKDDIKAEIAKHMATEVRASTVHKRFSILRTVMRFGVDIGVLDAVNFPQLPQVHHEKLMPPTPAELQAMLAVAPEHVRRAIVLGSQCGMRIGKCELYILKWQDVDFDRAVLCVHGAKKNINAPWREVPLRESLLDIMRVWYDADSRIGCDYIINIKGRHITQMQYGWARTLKLAGITRRIRPYDLRHAFATEAIAGGADIGTVASLMGHANPVMLLKHYQYILTTQKRAAIDALPELQYVPNRDVPKMSKQTLCNKF